MVKLSQMSTASSVIEVPSLLKIEMSDEFTQQIKQHIRSQTPYHRLSLC